ncbi:MAG TPA: hypothetical protein VH251_10565 [Verrucomicrobiae bacterium]|jgi:hypothetical protein|nr:hypothetical protein [Verrucomicrobiae bacterium]
MARANDEHGSLRLGRRESARVVVALLLSVILHFAFWAGYETGEKRGWWDKFKTLSWLHLSLKPFALQAQLAHDKRPDIFVDVSHADSDAPAQTKFYSNKNSRAANQDEANSNVPKINGTKADIVRTENVPKLIRQAANAPTEGAKDKVASDGPKETPKEEPKQAVQGAPKEAPKADAGQLAKLEPSMPPPSLSPPVPVPALEQPQTPGETDKPRPQTDTLSAPAPNLAQTQPQPQQVRPRTLRQALAQQDQLPGPQMQQDGGVARRAMWSSLDVKATAFGDYDRELIEAVQQRWDDLLDNHRYAEDRDGKVTLRFKLKPDGTVIEMQTLENNVGEVLGYLCQEAIEEAAPFAKWPPDMGRMIGTNYRDITFTFYYY